MKFDGKKLKAAAMREAEKAAAKKFPIHRPSVPKNAGAVCKHCRTKFSVPIENGICPYCHKPMD